MAESEKHQVEAKKHQEKIEKQMEETKKDQEETKTDKEEIKKQMEETKKHQEETKKHQEEIKKHQEETKKQVEGIERRLVAVEEQMVNDEQLSLQKVKPSVLSRYLVNQDVKLTCEDFPHLQKIISAGPNDKQALDVVDTIRKQDDKKLKTLLFSHLSTELTVFMKKSGEHANFMIWPGTKHGTEEIKFVCLYKGKIETQLPSFFGIDIHYSDMDMPAPLIDFKDRNLLKWKMSTDQDALLLQSAIEEHGDRLFKQHSNLQVICGGPFLLSEREHCVKECNTIILYCHAKGIIPYGEETFPLSLTFNNKEIPVDIREGHFVLAVGRQQWHETLRMGISIGENGKYFAGTLGPFVDLGNKEYGFLTCAHVVGETGTKVVQPSDGDIMGQKAQEENICGTVLKSVFDPDFSDRMNGLTKTGVDAALVKLNRNTKIDPTSFPLVPKFELLHIGFTPESKFLYIDGCIGGPQESGIALGKAVIKYGRTSGLRMGQMVLAGAMVKTDDLEMKSVKRNQNIILKGQYLIDRFRSGQFAEQGDSGAGVFMIDEENKLTLIGLVTGIINAVYDYRCVVTPIEHILRALDLTPDAFKINENIQTDSLD